MSYIPIEQALRGATAALYNGSVATWAAMPSATAFILGSTLRTVKFDLTKYTQARVFVSQGNAANTGAKLIAKYRTSFSSDIAQWSDLGTSEISVTLSATDNPDPAFSPSWIDIAAGAKGDVFLTLAGSGGNGVLSPTFANFGIQVR